MITEKINCDEAKKMDLVTYLESLSIKPQKVNGNDYWYLSPLRDEKTPSFKINRKLNVWYDHGLGKGGKLVDLGILLHHCSVQEFLEKLNTQEDSFSFHQPAIPPQNSKKVVENKIKLIGANPLSDPILYQYLETRNIPAEIAKNYCRQITYMNGQKQYFAIGFKNNSGGFELRSPNFKSTVSPKDFTLLNAQKWDAVAVFEGFTDFLSLIASDKQLIPELTNFLVLNSLSFFEKARPVMEQHERIYLLLDNDEAGKNCTKHALSLSYKYYDLSNKYEQDKDLNEWLMKEKKSEQHLVHRRGRRL
ncbi:MAG: toprim domain-containing protein [Bacteroidota bacterium]|nr:toprim domain-containing protein [Bacteroidota bacterium]